MSTRANIVLSESYTYRSEKGKMITDTEKLFFYRHWDGYPEGTLPLLNVFMNWLKSDVIRDNLSQASGWLIVLGAIEYNSIPKHDADNFSTIQPPEYWKVGSIEPTTGIHGDIEYLYEINLTSKELTYKNV